MNVLPSPIAQEAVSRVPQRSPGPVTPVRAMHNPGERPSPQRWPQAGREQQADVIDRLGRSDKEDSRLPLRGRRAVAAYNALSRAEEQAYMKQVLGFEITI